MPTFVELYENILDFGLAEVSGTAQLNDILNSLQKKGAKILDVKVSMTSIHEKEHRTYLILYEADKPIKREGMRI